MRDADNVPGTVGKRGKNRQVVPARDRHRLPMALMVLWTIYGCVVGINIAVWLLVCVTAGEFVYPWPVWVAGPLGALLLCATIGTQAIRNRYRYDNGDSHDPVD